MHILHRMHNSTVNLHPLFLMDQPLSFHTLFDNFHIPQALFEDTYEIRSELIERAWEYTNHVIDCLREMRSNLR